MHLSKWEIVRRYILLCVGLMIMATGIAFSIKADLGTTPISSVPFVFSEFTPVSVGVATVLMNLAFVALQVLILRRDFQPIQLMQIPVSFLFGFSTDVALGLISGITVSDTGEQWLLCILGVLLVGLGVACEVTANVVVAAGEGLVLAITTALKRRWDVHFPTIKISFDVTLVVISLTLSLLFVGGMRGVGLGTVAAALLVGLTAKCMARPMGWVNRRVLMGLPRRISVDDAALAPVAA